MAHAWRAQRHRRVLVGGPRSVQIRALQLVPGAQRAAPSCSLRRLADRDLIRCGYSYMTVTPTGQDLGCCLLDERGTGESGWPIAQPVNFCHDFKG